MIRFITDGNSMAVFFCDHCHAVLYRGPPGEACLVDLDILMSTEPSDQKAILEDELLCQECFESGRQSF